MSSRKATHPTRNNLASNARQVAIELLNARLLHAMPFDSVAERLPDWVDAEAWGTLRTALRRVDEVGNWEEVVRGDMIGLTLSVEDRAFLAQAVQLAAPIDWSDDPWHALTGALKERTGRKGKALFLPLRLALTGRHDGPELKSLLPLVGRTACLDRLP